MFVKSNCSSVAKLRYSGSKIRSPHKGFLFCFQGPKSTHLRLDRQAGFIIYTDFLINFSSLFLPVKTCILVFFNGFGFCDKKCVYCNE